MNLTELQSKLREEISQRGLNLNDIAEALGIPQPRVSEALNSERREQYRNQIAEYLGFLVEKTVTYKIKKSPKA